MPTMTNLYSAGSIKERVEKIAKDINNDFKGEELVHIVITLNGAFMFAADLVRLLDIPQQISFASASSYVGTQQGDSLSLNMDSLPRSFGNKPVILIEDIMDTGNTVTALRQVLADRMASTIKIAALLKRQGCDGHADYFGFTVPRGLFVIGYGMDMDSRYRELSDIQVLDGATMSGGGGVC